MQLYKSAIGKSKVKLQRSSSSSSSHRLRRHRRPSVVVAHIYIRVVSRVVVEAPLAWRKKTKKKTSVDE